VTRFCDRCQLHLPLRDFDLGSGQLSSICLACVQERTRTEDHVARSRRKAQIAELEEQRQELIVALGKIDKQIAETPPSRKSQIPALEKQRRSLIAALVKIDGQIAELRARPSSTSASFVRVEPSDIFEGAEDSVDSDLGFSD